MCEIPRQLVWLSFCRVQRAIEGSWLGWEAEEGWGCVKWLVLCCASQIVCCAMCSMFVVVKRVQITETVVNGESSTRTGIAWMRIQSMCGATNIKSIPRHLSSRTAHTAYNAQCQWHEKTAYYDKYGEAYVYIYICILGSWHIFDVDQWENSYCDVFWIQIFFSYKFEF